jgi:hypothetical protein
MAAFALVLATIDRLHRRHADLLDEQLRLLAMPPSVAKGGGIADVAAAQDRDAALARIAGHLEGGIELRAQAIAHSVAKASPCGTVLHPDPGRCQNRVQ